MYAARPYISRSWPSRAVGVDRLAGEVGAIDAPVELLCGVVVVVLLVVDGFLRAQLGLTGLVLEAAAVYPGATTGAVQYVWLGLWPARKAKKSLVIQSSSAYDLSWYSQVSMNW